MLKRTLTALIGLVVFFAIVLSHRFVVYAAIGAVTIMMLCEMYEMLDAQKGVRICGFVASTAFVGIALAGNLVVAFYAALSIFMIAMVILHGKADSREILSNAAVTLFIVSSMLSLMLIRHGFEKILVIFPFVVAWLTDTGAYFAGSLLGKHKLAPKLSPKKTVEGSIGGVLLAMIGSVVYAWILNGFVMEVRTALVFASIGLVGSVISQVGDLIASAIKRDCGKKDYGSILPGHGGALDRFDSVLFVTPFIYFALTYFSF